MKKTIKRLIDIVIAAISIIIFVIPMSVIALLIYKKMGAPILFTQKRAGEHGNSFLIYKFRTMNNKMDDKGNLLPNELRKDKFGDFLRRTSLDELPQLFNILKGDLSVVGPRPLLMEYVELYTEQQRRRLEVKPGLTGWAQVNGRNAISWKQKFHYDVWYVDNQSLFLDMKILFRTFSIVMKSEGVNTNTDLMVTRFLGNEDE